MNITLQELENDPRIFSEEQTIIDSYTDTVVNLETEFSYSGFDNGSLNKFFDFRKPFRIILTPYTCKLKAPKNFRLQSWPRSFQMMIFEPKLAYFSSNFERFSDFYEFLSSKID